MRGFGHPANPVDWAREYIAAVRWQFAKTMPQWPHEYTVRSWEPERADDFEQMASLTRELGVVKPWPYESPKPRYHHAYLEIDGWEYWIMDGQIAETEVINRALIRQASSSPDRSRGLDRDLPISPD
jgi:hypothetical protein